MGMVIRLTRSVTWIPASQNGAWRIWSPASIDSFAQRGRDLRDARGLNPPACVWGCLQRIPPNQDALVPAVERAGSADQGWNVRV